MLSVGSIISSNSKGQFLSEEVIHQLMSTFTSDYLFNYAWKSFIDPWSGDAYATLNLKTGLLEGRDEFSMRSTTPYLILFKISLESLAPEDILTEEELGEYEKFEQSLKLFCEKYEVNVKQRAKSYYKSHWDTISCMWIR